MFVTSVVYNNPEHLMGLDKRDAVNEFVNWYQECFGVTVDSPRQSIVYNRYATLIFTNPVFLGFSRYANVNFGSQRDNLSTIQCVLRRFRKVYYTSGLFVLGCFFVRTVVQ